MKRFCVCSAAAACLAVAPMTMVGRAAQDTRTTPDISGFWELNFDSRQVPRASLVPSVTRAKIDAHAKGDAYAVRWCNLLGVPFVMDPGRPIDIRQGATAVIIAPENSSAPRYLYTNRAAHITEDIFDASTNGDSIAHWEGDTLVVDVTHFNGKNWFDRAGNFHSDALHLVERFTPITPDAIQYEVTIEDPKVFTRPWRIAMPLYRRLEPNAQLMEYRCIEFVEEFLYGNLRKQQLVKRWEGDTIIVDITRKVPPGEKLNDWYRR